MSDMIRQLMGQRRGPVGMGNNPSPFPIPYRDQYTDMIEKLTPDEEPGAGQPMLGPGQPSDEQDARLKALLQKENMQRGMFR